MNTFHANKAYTVELFIEGNNVYEQIASQDITFEALGQSESFLLDGMNLADGEYTIYFDLVDEAGNLVFSASKIISVGSPSSSNELAQHESSGLSIQSLGAGRIRAELPTVGTYHYQVFSLSGQLLFSGQFSGTSVDLQFPTTGLFVITVYEKGRLYTEKVFVHPAW